jgi:hypothetical protein
MTDQPNPLTQLTELHSLHAEWVKAGLDAWWPERVLPGYPSIGWFYDDNAGGWSRLDPADALTLVVAAGERVLFGLGWCVEYGDSGPAYTVNGCVTTYNTLAEALRAVMESKGQIG